MSLRTLQVLAVCAVLGAGPAFAQSAADGTDVHEPDGPLEAALISAVHDGAPAAFQALLLVEKVYVPITEETFRAILAARQQGGPPLDQVRVEILTFRVDEGPDTALFFTSEPAFKRSQGDKPWLRISGREALSLLPPGVPASIQDSNWHSAMFTASEIQTLLARR